MVKVINEKIVTLQQMKEIIPERQLSFVFFADKIEDVNSFIEENVPSGNLFFFRGSDPQKNEHYEFSPEIPQVAAFIGEAFIESFEFNGEDDVSEFFEGVYHFAEGMVD